MASHVCSFGSGAYVLDVFPYINAICISKSCVIGDHYLPTCHTMQRSPMIQIRYIDHILWHR